MMAVPLVQFFRALPRPYYVAILLASLLNISPYVMQHDGADIWMYLTWMRCFSEQFWQGDIYPRWCMDSNAGLGTPLFLFYFPLPFYIAALLHPLNAMGLDYYSLFVVMAFMASVLTALACFAWLADVVEERYALLASILLLFMPYRLEMMFFRGSLAEIWCMVWLPLLFKHIRRLARGDDAVVPVALLAGLALLTHIPLAAGALIMGGVYVMAMTGKRWRPKLQYLMGACWGGMLALFYMVPGEYYHRFLASSQLADRLYGWPNNYLDIPFFIKTPGLERPLMTAALGQLLLVGFASVALAKRERIGDDFARREAIVWSGLGALALLMLFPLSASLYALMGPFAKVVFPWRMQMFAALATAYLLAVWMQWQMAQRRRETWKTDFGLALLALWAISQFMVASYSEKDEALNETIRKAKIVFASEYRTRWTDESHWGFPYLLERMTHDIPQAQVIAGKGRVEVRQWGWRGIELAVDGSERMLVRLNHSYFPVWRLRHDKDEAVRVYPESGTGLMLVEAMPGSHDILLQYDVAGTEDYLLSSQYMSAMAWILLALMWLKLRFCNPQRNELAGVATDVGC